jgi:peptidoglycan hydrolase-like protein with peptidoglycan-binding domain
MPLKYLPFAASLRMQDASRSNPPLRLNSRGLAVALLQGGLIQQGIPMPLSTKKGFPDGAYGSECAAAVMTFQRRNGLVPVDGIAGRDTISLLDDLLAKAASPLPVPPLGPPSSPVDRNYEIGTRDPPRGHDPGAGVWNSKPTEASYVALKISIIEVLPEAILVIGDDAVRHMAHYLNNSGRDLTIDLEGMVKEVPSAKGRYEREVSQIQRFVETLPPGTNPITSKNVEVGYNTQRESKNWFFAIGGYSSWGKGIATVADGPTGRSYEVDFEYKFYDRYNWDAGKSVTFSGVTVTDKFMGEFHRQGIAKEYDCNGSFKRRFTWTKGKSIAQGQIDGPGGR